MLREVWYLIFPTSLLRKFEGVAMTRIAGALFAFARSLRSLALARFAGSAKFFRILCNICIVNNSKNIIIHSSKT
jgi:hypothetical protein